jgi:predicted dehydrogenase
MTTPIKRRKFIYQSAAASAALLAPVAKAVPSERVRVACIGASGRARALNLICARNPEIDLVAIADVDLSHLPKTVDEVTKIQGNKPRTVQDFRKLLDDPSIDALVVGTPDHWHAIPTILGCMAGKDIYVEKPDAHDIVEGQRMIEAANKYQRIVQMGSQHRSTHRMQSALEWIRAGNLGEPLVAKAWESAAQRSIGHPPDGKAPPEVDYDMWLGSAPKRPFNPNRFHGRWRWFFDYGTGDLGNDGVHRLDQAFAALNAAIETAGGEPVVKPHKISAMGGKWYFDDMQEFPDTMQVNYEYAGQPPRLLTYEMRIWTPYKYLGSSEGSAVFGDKGYILISNNDWQGYTANNKLVKQVKGDADATPHMQNFIDCIKSRKRPYCDLETVGHPASLMCHAGNIAWRVGRTLTLDSETETFVDDAEATALCGRPEWRAPWVLPEV